ncbi:hypothetical protein KIPB_003305, partial [Kipferlia bialata]|eukprot:g3305.t1
MLAKDHSYNRTKLFERLSAAGVSGLVYLVGADNTELYDTDRDMQFRQESYFFWATGCTVPGSIAVLDIATKQYKLFIPKVSDETAVWIGVPPTLAEYAAELIHCPETEELLYTEALPEYLAQAKPSAVHCLVKMDLDVSCPITSDVLRAHMSECRVIKSDAEVEALYAACVAGAEGHTACMHKMLPGTQEYVADGLMHTAARNHESYWTSFETISAVGKHASTLHFLGGATKVEDGKILLIDAGVSVKGYVSDHTRVMPGGSRFTPNQEAMYNIVLRANKECIKGCKPGTKWEDLHALSLRILLEGLREHGLVRKDTGSIEEQLDLDIPAVFMPHGLGHLIGCDTHDVGGYPAGVERMTRPGYRNMRMRRTLDVGYAVTVEPGMYFVPQMVDAALASEKQGPHLNE